MRTEPNPSFHRRLVKTLCLGLSGMSAACAHGGDEPPVRPSIGEVTSYPVPVDTKAPEPPNALVNTATGLLIGDPWTVGCPADVCDLLINWGSSVSGWSVGRLSTGEYIYLAATDENSWFWRRGSDIEAVTEAMFREWPGRTDSPRWVPAIEGYALKATKPLPLFEDVFVGLWKSTEASGPLHLVALFKDQETGTIDFGSGDRQPCLVAAVDVPVIAISASDPLHGVAWGLTLVLRPEGANHISILGYSLFPHELKCMEAPE